MNLKGKRGLVVGIANDKSIAWACAKQMHEYGAEIAATWHHDKLKERITPLLDQINVKQRMALDVTNDEQMQEVFEHLKQEWGQIDFLIHSIAFAPRDDLHGRVTDCSRKGFLQAMDISCHSFLRLAHLAEPLMTNGGSLMTMSYLGSSGVVPGYGMMGPVKAALESSVRYLAAELGEKNIRVNALSPGPIATRAASGLLDLEGLLSDVAARAPLRDPLTIDDVGQMAAFLASQGGRSITGSTIYIDCGHHIIN